MQGVINQSLSEISQICSLAVELLAKNAKRAQSRKTNKDNELFTILNELAA